MFEAVKLPARITDLNSSLTNMKTDNLPHPESKSNLSQGREGSRENRERKRKKRRGEEDAAEWNCRLAERKIEIIDWINKSINQLLMCKKREILETKEVCYLFFRFKLKPSVGIECGETVVFSLRSFHFHPLSFSSILSSHALLARRSWLYIYIYIFWFDAEWL